MKTIAALVLGLFIAGSVSADEGDGVEGAKGNKGADGKAHAGQRWERRFDKIDTNHDGQISKEEFSAWRQAHHHHKKNDK